MEFLAGVVVFIVLGLTILAYVHKRMARTAEHMPHVYVAWKNLENKYQITHWDSCWCKTGAAYADTYARAAETFKRIVGMTPDMVRSDFYAPEKEERSAGAAGPSERLS